MTKPHWRYQEPHSHYVGGGVSSSGSSCGSGGCGFESRPPRLKALICRAFSNRTCSERRESVASQAPVKTQMRRSAVGRCRVDARKHRISSGFHPWEQSTIDPVIARIRNLGQPSRPFAMDFDGAGLQVRREEQSRAMRSSSLSKAIFSWALAGRAISFRRRLAAGCRADRSGKCRNW